jgi:hypothetical protein
MKRLVEIDRWKDNFFMELSPYAKLILSYLYDTCNPAGIFDVNWSLMQVQLKMKKIEIKQSLTELQPLLLSDKKNKLFIKDFLKHQMKLPLIRGNEESDWIILKLEESLPKFNNAKEILDILDKVKDKEPIVNDNSKNTSTRANKVKFVPPTYKEFYETYLVEKPDAIEEKIKNLYDHYVSVGWKVGNKPMADYAAAIRKNMNNNFNTTSNNNYNHNNGEKKSKVEKTMNVVEKMTNQNPIIENNN